MSVIDFPKKELDPEVWDCSMGECRLHTKVKELIIDTFRLFILQVLNDAYWERYVDELLLTGSIATYQWRYDSDIDVTVKLKTEFFDTEYFDLLRSHLSEINSTVFVGKHPVNYYLTFVVNYKSFDAVYDVLNDVWIKRPPELAPFDPRVRFLSIWYKAEQWCESMDDVIMDLRRNLIDYSYMMELLSDLEDDKMKFALLQMVERRLEEINEDIRVLVDQYNELSEERKLAYEAIDNETTLRELLSAAWLPQDIKYKFVERYKYNQLAQALRRLLKTSPSIQTEEQIEQVKDALNTFFELPKRTSAVLFSYFTKEGQSKRYREYPYKFMRKRLKLDKKRLPFNLPKGFFITEKNMANEVVVTEEQGFNTLYPKKPLPDSVEGQATPSWEQANSLLMVPATLQKLAQEETEAPPPASPDLPPSPAVADAFKGVDTGGENEPVVEELREVLSPSLNEAEEHGLQIKETPESFFKSKEPGVPESVKQLTDMDKYLYYELEKKRTEAINKGDVAALRLVDSKIEALLEKYFQPVPTPKPITDSSTLAASVKKGASGDRQLDEVVEALFFVLAKVGLPVSNVRLGYSGDKVYEFIIDVPVRVVALSESFEVQGMQAGILPITFKPVIVRVEKESGVVLPYMWTLSGERYDLNSEGVKELLYDLYSQVSGKDIKFVVGM